MNIQNYMSMYLNLTTFLVVWNTNAFQLFNVLIYYLDLVISRLIKNEIEKIFKVNQLYQEVKLNSMLCRLISVHVLKNSQRPV